MPKTIKAFAAGALVTWLYDHRAGIAREWRFVRADVRDLRAELRVRLAH